MSGLCSDTRHYFTRIWGNAAGRPGGWGQRTVWCNSEALKQVQYISRWMRVQNLQFYRTSGKAEDAHSGSHKHRLIYSTQNIAQVETKGRFQLPRGGLCFQVILWSPRQERSSIWWLPTLSGLTSDPRTPKSFVILHQTVHKEIWDWGFTAKCKYYKARAPTGCCWGQRWPFRMKLWDTAGHWWEARGEMWLNNLQHTANIRLSYTFTHLRRHQGQNGVVHRGSAPDASDRWNKESLCTYRIRQNDKILHVTNMEILLRLNWRCQG